MQTIWAGNPFRIIVAGVLRLVVRLALVEPVDHALGSAALGSAESSRTSFQRRMILPQCCS